MATVCYFSSCVSVSSRKLSLTHHVPRCFHVWIEFFGDGENVEVAGSFNGWHHRTKMDPQKSTSVMVSTASRRSRIWSTVLWLYPGVYEIKFIVDDHWRIDPQRESVTRGHICNNILRVDRWMDNIWLVSELLMG